MLCSGLMCSLICDGTSERASERRARTYGRTTNVCCVGLLAVLAACGDSIARNRVLLFGSEKTKTKTKGCVFLFLLSVSGRTDEGRSFDAFWDVGTGVHREQHTVCPTQECTPGHGRTHGRTAPTEVSRRRRSSHGLPISRHVFVHGWLFCATAEMALALDDG